jgi:preprotein translocase SecE subunit
VQDLDTYRKETWDELKKVTWLSREENIRLTYIVLIVTAVSAAFLGLVSFLYGLLTQALASSTSGVAAGVVVIVMIIGVAAAWLLRDRLFPTRYE